MVTTLGSLGTAIRTAQSGLATTQGVLDVIANNVTNVNTPGYSRKEAALDHKVLGGLGVGVGIERISRSVDQSLLTTLRRENGTLAAAAVGSRFEARLQDLFGTPDSNASLAHVLAELGSAVEALAAAPDGAIEAREVVRRGGDAATTLNRLSQTLQKLRLDADQRIGQGVGEADALLTQIADLNGRIVRERHAGRDTTALEDQRDTAVDRLSTLADVRVMSRGKGDVVVFTASGWTLVDSEPVRLSHNPAAALGPLATHAAGDIGGLYAGAPSPATDLTAVFAAGTGELGALIRLRDQTLPDVQATLDTLARTLKDTVNRVHNQGTAYPGLSTLTGSRVFADPATETIRLAAGDVALTVFDGSGAQLASTPLSTLMGGGSGPWTISNVAGAVDAWLKANSGPAASASVSDGRLVVDLGTRSKGLAIRDQASATAGAAAGEATIAYSADGGAGADATVMGFSTFFGLNDFFVDATSPAIRQSPVMAEGWRAGAGGTLEFRDESGLIGAPVVIAAGSDLAAIARAITDATGLAAGLVPEGDGVRLRVQSATARTVIPTETAGALLATLGLAPASTGVAGSLAVRADIAAAPERVARGGVRFDASVGVGGEYVLARGDGQVMAELAAALGGATPFAAAGGFGASVDSVAAYAQRIVAASAARATEVADREAFQKDFVAALQAKSDGLRGVNLDQELSEMMLFEQAYSAAARLISVVQRMFDALEGAV